MVPVFGGVLSALGMLVAPRERQMSRTLAQPLAQLDLLQLGQQAQLLAEQGLAELAAEGVDKSKVKSFCDEHQGVYRLGDFKVDVDPFTFELIYKGH